MLNDKANPEYIIEAYVGKGGAKVALLNVNAIQLPEGNPDISLAHTSRPNSGERPAIAYAIAGL